MYSEWFSKSVAVAENIPLDSDQINSAMVISNFLKSHGYREISSTKSEINAVRGRKIWNLFNIGDPRRNYHTTKVILGCDPISGTTNIDSWFGIGTKHDKAVFTAEIEMLQHLLQTRESSSAPLQEAQALRLKSDIKTFLIIAGVGVLIGIGATTVIILMNELG